jgi:hypothetical protein
MLAKKGKARFDKDKLFVNPLAIRQTIFINPTQAIRVFVALGLSL